MKSIADETAAVSSAPEAGEPKPSKKASVAKRARNVAPAKAKSSKKASPAKKASKSAKKASTSGDRSVRDGSKASKILDLLKRPGGGTLKEIMKASGWQAHSVRGFISGTLGKKMSLKVESAKRDDGERVYSINS